MHTHIKLSKQIKMNKTRRMCRWKWLFLNLCTTSKVRCSPSASSSSSSFLLLFLSNNSLEQYDRCAWAHSLHSSSLAFYCLRPGLRVRWDLPLLLLLSHCNGKQSMLNWCSCANKQRNWTSESCAVWRIFSTSRVCNSVCVCVWIIRVCALLSTINMTTATKKF